IAAGGLNPLRWIATLLRARGPLCRLQPGSLGGAGIRTARRRRPPIWTPAWNEDLGIRVRPDTPVAKPFDGALRGRDLLPGRRGLSVHLGHRDQRERERQKARTTPAL